MGFSEMVEALKTCELFSFLPHDDVVGLVASLPDSQMHSYQAGEMVFTQGDHITKIYVIAEGEVSIKRVFNRGGQTVNMPVALLGKGRAMGWTALLYRPQEATATALCQKPTRVVAIEGTSLRSILGKQSRLGLRVMDQLAYMLGDRLRSTYAAMETL